MACCPALEVCRHPQVPGHGQGAQCYGCPWHHAVPCIPQLAPVVPILPCSPGSPQPRSCCSTLSWELCSPHSPLALPAASPPPALLAALPCSHCTEAADSAQQPGVPMHWERANFPAGPDFPRLPRTTVSPAAAGSAKAWPGQCGGPTAHTSAPLVQHLSGCCSTHQQPAARRFPSPVLELCPDTGRCL